MVSKERLKEDAETKATSKELKRIFKGVELEKKTHVKSLEQPKNSEFRKVKGSPITKRRSGIIGQLMSRKAYVKNEAYSDLLKEEMKKEEPDIELVRDYTNRLKEGEKIYRESSYKTPLLEMIRADGRIEWFEGVKAGTLQITRSDEKVAYIDLRKDKLLTDSIRNQDGTVVQKWVCYENDQNPLPQNHYMDSHGYFSNLEEIMMAKKDWKTEQLKARGDLYMQIFIGVAIVLAVLILPAVLFDFNVFEELGIINNAPPTQSAPNVDEADILTVDELDFLEQYRAQKAEQEADLNSGG